MYRLCRLNGFDNIQAENGSYLNSAYNPIKEAKLKLEGVKASKKDMLAVFGCGAGYIIDCAAAEFGVENFLIIEPDQGIIQLALKRPETAAVIEGRNNRVYFFDKTNFDSQLLFEILMLSAAKPLKIIESPYFRKMDEQFLMKSLECVKTSYLSVIEIAKKFRDPCFVLKAREDHFLKLASDLVFYEAEEDYLS
jgi:hypothetical protein